MALRPIDVYRNLRYRLLLAAESLWSPTELFTSSEVGAWYDPSDFSTMYQDSAGTTPVTAVGQPVGLLLDKSQGLVLGPELVTNGTFDADTNWNKGTGWTIGSGIASVNTASGYPVLSQARTFTAGKAYKVTCDVAVTTGISGVTFSTKVGRNIASFTGTGSRTCIFIADGTETYIGVQAANAVCVATIDNISVKELPGNHATQATAASRPILRESGGLYYLEFDGVDDVLTCKNPDLGTDATLAIALAAGASIAQNQTIGANYVYNTDDSFGLILVDRNLTAGEVTDLTAYLDGKAGA